MRQVKRRAVGVLAALAFLLDWSQRVREASTRSGEFTLVSPLGALGLLSWLALAALVAAVQWIVWPWPWRRGTGKNSVVYDTKRDGWIGYFDYPGWLSNENLRGDIGEGEVRLDPVDKSILILQRRNTANRYSLEIRHYACGYDDLHPRRELPADLSFDGPRWVRVTFEARAVRGWHELEVFVQYSPSGAWLDSEDRPRRARIASETWDTFQHLLKTRAGEACYVRLDSVAVSESGAAFALKNLRIEVEGNHTK